MEGNKSISPEKIKNIISEKRATNMISSDIKSSLAFKLLRSNSIIAYSEYNFLEDQIFSHITGILSKTIRTPSEIQSVVEFIKSLREFNNMIKSVSANYEDLLFNIAIALRYEKVHTNRVICKFGEKGKKFYVILKGKVTILLPKQETCMLTQDEYYDYLLRLKMYKEKEILIKVLSNNKYIFPLEMEEILWLKGEINSIKERKKVSPFENYLYRFARNECLEEADNLYFNIWNIFNGEGFNYNVNKYEQRLTVEEYLNNVNPKRNSLMTSEENNNEDSRSKFQKKTLMSKASLANNNNDNNNNELVEENDSDDFTPVPKFQRRTLRNSQTLNINAFSFLNPKVRASQNKIANIIANKDNNSNNDKFQGIQKPNNNNASDNLKNNNNSNLETISAMNEDVRSNYMSNIQLNQSIMREEKQSSFDNDLIPFFYNKIRDAKEVTVWIYYNILSLKTGDKFGDTALTSANQKRTATIISDMESHLGVMDKKSYVKCLKDLTEKSKRWDMNFILSQKVFSTLNVNIFQRNYFNQFVNRKLNRGDILIKEGEAADKIYVIKHGHFEVSLKKNNIEMYKTIEKLGGNTKKFFNELDLIHENKEYVDFMNKPIIAKIEIIKDNDIIGLNDIVIDHKFVFSIELVSLKGEIFELQKNFYDTMLKGNEDIRNNDREFRIMKKNYWIERLTTIVASRTKFFRTFKEETFHEDKVHSDQEQPSPNERKKINLNDLRFSKKINLNSTFYNSNTQYFNDINLKLKEEKNRGSGQKKSHRKTLSREKKDEGNKLYELAMSKTSEDKRKKRYESFHNAFNNNVPPVKIKENPNPQLHLNLNNIKKGRTVDMENEGIDTYTSRSQTYANLSRNEKFQWHKVLNHSQNINNNCFIFKTSLKPEKTTYSEDPQDQIEKNYFTIEKIDKNINLLKKEILNNLLYYPLLKTSKNRRSLKTNADTYGLNQNSTNSVNDYYKNNKISSKKDFKKIKDRTYFYDEPLVPENSLENYEKQENLINQDHYAGKNNIIENKVNKEDEYNEIQEEKMNLDFNSNNNNLKIVNTTISVEKTNNEKLSELINDTEINLFNNNTKNNLNNFSNFNNTQAKKLNSGKNININVKQNKNLNQLRKKESCHLPISSSLNIRKLEFDFLKTGEIHDSKRKENLKAINKKNASITRSTNINNNNDELIGKENITSKKKKIENEELAITESKQEWTPNEKIPLKRNTLQINTLQIYDQGQVKLSNYIAYSVKTPKIKEFLFSSYNHNAYYSDFHNKNKYDNSDLKEVTIANNLSNEDKLENSKTSHKSYGISRERVEKMESIEKIDYACQKNFSTNETKPVSSNNDGDSKSLSKSDSAKLSNIKQNKSQFETNNTVKYLRNVTSNINQISNKTNSNLIHNKYNKHQNNKDNDLYFNNFHDFNDASVSNLSRLNITNKKLDFASNKFTNPFCVNSNHMSNSNIHLNKIKKFKVYNHNGKLVDYNNSKIDPSQKLLCNINENPKKGNPKLYSSQNVNGNLNMNNSSRGNSEWINLGFPTADSAKNLSRNFNVNDDLNKKENNYNPSPTRPYNNANDNKNFIKSYEDSDVNIINNKTYNENEKTEDKKNSSSFISSTYPKDATNGDIIKTRDKHNKNKIFRNLMLKNTQNLILFNKKANKDDENNSISSYINPNIFNKINTNTKHNNNSNNNESKNFNCNKSNNGVIGSELMKIKNCEKILNENDKISGFDSSVSKILGDRKKQAKEQTKGLINPYKDALFDKETDKKIIDQKKNDLVIRSYSNNKSKEFTNKLSQNSLIYDAQTPILKIENNFKFNSEATLNPELMNKANIKDQGQAYDSQDYFDYNSDHDQSLKNKKMYLIDELDKITQTSKFNEYSSNQNINRIIYDKVFSDILDLENQHSNSLHKNSKLEHDNKNKNNYKNINANKQGQSLINSEASKKNDNFIDYLAIDKFNEIYFQSFKKTMGFFSEPKFNHINIKNKNKIIDNKNNPNLLEKIKNSSNNILNYDNSFPTSKPLERGTKASNIISLSDFGTFNDTIRFKSTSTSRFLMVDKAKKIYQPKKILNILTGEKNFANKFGF